MFRLLTLCSGLLTLAGPLAAATYHINRPGSTVRAGK